MRTIQTSLNGGEMSPEMFGHVDDPKLRNGAKTIRNFVCLPAGGAMRRPGTRFVNETKNSAKKSTLIPFRWSIDQTMAIQVGEGYFRFHTGASTVLFATERRIASVDTITETITFTKAHGFANNDQIRFFAQSGGSVPAGLTGGTTYYVIPVDATRIKVSASTGPLGAVNITGVGSGVMSAWLNSECPPLYVGSKNVTAAIVVTSINTVTGEMTTSSSHFLTTGDIVFNPSTAVGGLAVNTNYYAIVTASNKFKVANTLADALGNIPVAPLAATTGTMAYRSNIACGLGHGLDTGNPVVFRVSGGTIIGGVQETIVYYAKVITPNVFQLCSTQALALVGTSLDIITGVGTGTTRMHYGYEAGDLVTNINVPQGFYHCRIRLPLDNTPGGSPTYWYQMPMTGEFELPNDYLESELFDIDYSQSNDVLRLAHTAHPMMDLRRISALRWSSTVTSIGPALQAPSNLAVTPVFGQYLSITAVTVAAPAVFTTVSPHFLSAGQSLTIMGLFWQGLTTLPDGNYIVDTAPTPTTFTVKLVSGGAVVGNAVAYPGTGGFVQISDLSASIDNTYKVTAIDERKIESAASSPISSVNNLLVAGSKNVITWSSVPGAVRYNIYKSVSGLFAQIGTTDALSFNDEYPGIAPNASITIPYQDATLSTNYPAAVAWFQQRSIVGGFTQLPQTFLATRTGTDGDMSFHIPIFDSDRVSATISATQLCRIQYIVPMAQLLLMTDSTEFRVVPLDGDSLKPSPLDIRPVSYVGSAKVKPVVANGSVVFAAARGGHLFEMGFSNEAGGFTSSDLCSRSGHMFEGAKIVSMAQQRAPYPIVWAVNDQGKLLGITYMPGEGIGAWHQHDTDGLFEAVCVVAEGAEDAVYVVVNRTINGSTKRYVERIEPFAPKTRTTAWHVDCGLSYSGTKVTSLSGLDHLEGETVKVLADGKAYEYTVSGGSITLDRASATVIAGLPMTSDIVPPPWAASLDAYGQGRVKNIGKIAIRVRNSGPFLVGPTFDDLVPANETTGLVTAEVPTNLVPNWDRDASTHLRIVDPFPCVVLGMSVNVTLGGG